MKTRNVYITDDGQEFDDEATAKLHEKRLEISKHIHGFLGKHEITGKKSVEYERIIVAWESHKENGPQENMDLSVVA